MKSFIYKLTAAVLIVSVMISACSIIKPAYDYSHSIDPPVPSETIPVYSDDSLISSEISIVSKSDISSHTTVESDEEFLFNLLNSMSIEEKVGQLFIIDSKALISGDGTKVNSSLNKNLSEYHVGGFIFFKSCFKSKKQTKALLEGYTEAANESNTLPLFLGVDEEGGTVARLANTPEMKIKNTKDMADIGKTGNSENAYEAGIYIGTYLNNLGFNLDFAPDSDVLTNKNNTLISRRSFGSNPEIVSEMSMAYLKGLNEMGVAGMLKHFPGHGGTIGDSHEGYSYTNFTIDDFRKADLIPFINGIDHGADMILVGHISLPKITDENVPASLSKEIITDLLRNDLHFDGVIITDALNMKAISKQYTSVEACKKAFLAGADILLMPKDFKSAYKGILDAIENNEITEERLNESVLRILRFKLKYGIIKTEE